MLKKSPLVPLTGGLDSTFALLSLYDKELCWKLEGKLREDEDHPETLYLINSGNSAAKTFAELRARQKVFKYIRDNITPNLGRDQIVKFEFQFEKRQLQAVSWIYSMVHLVDPRRHSRVVMGYVLGDSVQPFLPDLRKAWEGLCKVVHGTIVPLDTPILDVTKTSILKCFKERRKDVADLVWTCETPVFEEGEVKACGWCKPCHARRQAEVEVEKGICTLAPVETLVRWEDLSTISVWKFKQLAEEGTFQELLDEAIRTKHIK